MLPGLGLAPAPAQAGGAKPSFTILEFGERLGFSSETLTTEQFDVRYTTNGGMNLDTLAYCFSRRDTDDPERIITRVIEVFVDGKFRKGMEKPDLAVFAVDGKEIKDGSWQAFGFCARITELALASKFASTQPAKQLARELLMYTMKHEYDDYADYSLRHVFSSIGGLPATPTLHALGDFTLLREDPALVRVVQTKPIWYGNRLLAIDVLRTGAPEVKYIGGFSGHGDTEKYKHIFDKSKEGQSVVLPEREQVIRDWLVRMGAPRRPPSDDDAGAGAGAARPPKRPRTEERKTFRVAVSTDMIQQRWSWGIEPELPVSDGSDSNKMSNRAKHVLLDETQTLDVTESVFPLRTSSGDADAKTAAAIKDVLRPGWTDAVVVFVPKLMLPLSVEWTKRVAALGYQYWMTATPAASEDALDAARLMANDARRDDGDGSPYLPLELLLAIRYEPQFNAAMRFLHDDIEHEDMDDTALPEFKKYEAALRHDGLPPVLFVVFNEHIGMIRKGELPEYLQARWGKLAQKEARVDTRARALGVALRQYGQMALRTRLPIEEGKGAEAALKERPGLPPDVLKMIAAMSLSGHCEICERSSSSGGDDGVVKCAKCGQEVCKDLCYATHVKRNHTSS